MPDTGGPGRHRGGASCSYAIVPHGVDEIASVVPHFNGTLAPESVGIAGGSPGATNQPFLITDTDVLDAFRAGRLPVDPREIRGQRRALPGIAHVRVGAGDVFGVLVTGGGGWGDALERDPAAVATDVRSSLVTAAAAVETYGVVLDEAGAVDGPATEQRRQALRQARRRRARVPADQPHPYPEPCPVCADRRELSYTTESTAVARRPLTITGTDADVEDEDKPVFALGETYCTRCWRLIDVDRVIATDSAAPQAIPRGGA